MKKGLIRRVKMHCGEYMYFIPANGKHEKLRHFLNWLSLRYSVWEWLYKITHKKEKTETIRVIESSIMSDGGLETVVERNGVPVILKGHIINFNDEIDGDVFLEECFDVAVTYTNSTDKPTSGSWAGNSFELEDKEEKQ